MKTVNYNINYKEISDFPVTIRNSLIKFEDRILANWDTHSTLDKNFVCNYLNVYFLTGANLGYFNEKNFNHIAKSIDKIVSINAMPRKDRNLNCYTDKTDENNKKIYFNQNMNATKTLTGEAHSILQLFSALGQNLTLQDAISIQKFVQNDKQIDIKNDILDNLTNDGVLAIKKVLSQEIAEDILYNHLRKDRPSARIVTNPYMFGLTKAGITKALPTRLDFDGELEKPVIDFAKTLKNVGNPYFDNGDINNAEFRESIMFDFCVKAMQPACLKDIITEYKISKPQNSENDLYLTLACLGYLCNAKYQSFGKLLSLDEPTKIENCNYSADFINYVGEKYQNLELKNEDYITNYPDYFESQNKVPTF